MTDETRTIEDVEIVTGHTPGPWLDHEQDGEYYVNDSIAVDIVYRVLGNGADEEKANARLIAQAPQMQRVIQQQHERIEEYRNALEEIAHLVITGHNAKGTLARIALSLSGMEDAGMIHPERQQGAEEDA